MRARFVVALLIAGVIAGVPLFTAGCDWLKGGSKGAQITAAAIDCTVDAVKAEVPKLLPLALGVLTSLAIPDGAAMLALAELEKIAGAAAVCTVQQAVAILRGPTAPTSQPMLKLVPSTITAEAIQVGVLRGETYLRTRKGWR
jgi:hypothetical protein